MMWSKQLALNEHENEDQYETSSSSTDPEDARDRVSEVDLSSQGGTDRKAPDSILPGDQS
jgi:hypothetical protein